VLCCFRITGLSIVLVREECPNIVKFGQVENFVSPLRLNFLPETGRLRCLV